MRLKDFLRFLAVAVAFILLLFIFHRLNPPKPPEPKPDRASDDKPTVPATPENVVGGFAMHEAVQLHRDDAGQRKALANRAPPYHLLGAMAGPGWAASGKPIPRPATARKTFELGSKEEDSPFHLGVTLDARGACVRRIVLNKFKAADNLGHPTKDLLELIPEQEDPPGDYNLGSNILYHYDGPDAKRPLDTLARRTWDVVEVVNDEDEDEHRVRFRTRIEGVELTKTFRLDRRTYHLGLEVGIRSTGEAKEPKFRYQLSGGVGLPIEGRWYTSTFRHALVGLVEGGSLDRNYQDSRSIAAKQGGDAVPVGEDRYLQYAGVAVQYFASVIAVDDDQDDHKFITSARPTLEARVVPIEAGQTFTTPPGKLSLPSRRDRGRDSETFILPDDLKGDLPGPKHGKFGLLVIPNPEPDGPELIVKVLSEAETVPQFHDDITVRVNTKPVDLSDGKEVVHKYLLYNGPVKPRLLGQMTGDKAVADGLVDRYVDTLHLNTLTDYHSPGFMGSFASSIGLTFLIITFTNICHTVLNLLHMVIPSYGICIMLLTVLVRGLMFPISRKQALTSLKMQALAPELKKLKDKYGDDRQAFALAQMELYRKHKISMFGSCWMIFLQMPIFMGLYYCLQESVHFRLAEFLWIRNLGAPDMLLYWSESIPMISRPESYGGFLYLGPYLNILPILAVCLMMYQQAKLMPPPADEQQAMQQKMMRFMMILVAFMFYKVAAGLCIYFITSSLWGFAERKLLPKKKPDLAGSDPGGDTGPSLLDRLRGEPAPTPPAPKPVPVGQSNRARRRQERKRRQGQRGPQPTQASQPEAPPTPPKEDGSFWTKVGDWWKDLLKKASKK